MNLILTSVLVLISISKVLSLIGSDSGLLDGISGGLLKTLPVKTDNLPLGPVKDQLNIVNQLPVGVVKGVAGNVLNNIPIVGGVKGGITGESPKAAAAEALVSDDESSQSAAAPVSPGKNKRKGKEGNNKKRSDKTKSTSKKQRQGKVDEPENPSEESESTPSEKGTNDSEEGSVSDSISDSKKAIKSAEEKLKKSLKDTKNKVKSVVNGGKKSGRKAEESVIDLGASGEEEDKRRRKGKSSGKQRNAKNVEKRDVNKYLTMRNKRAESDTRT